MDLKIYPVNKDLFLCACNYFLSIIFTKLDERDTEENSNRSRRRCYFGHYRWWRIWDYSTIEKITADLTFYIFARGPAADNNNHYAGQRADNNNHYADQSSDNNNHYAGQSPDNNDTYCYFDYAIYCDQIGLGSDGLPLSKTRHLF